MSLIDKNTKKERHIFHWIIISIVIILIGSVVTIETRRVIQLSNLPQATSNQIFTSTGGVFEIGTKKNAPSWSLPNLREINSSLSLNKFRGKPIVLNFWASWCAPCRQEMPALAATSSHLGDKVQFIGIDTSDQRSTAMTFASKMKVKYPLAFDPNASIAHHYEVYGMPTTYFISSNGKILGRQIGGMTEQRLNQLLKKTFKIN